MMSYKLFILFTIIILSLTGCWDQENPEDLATILVQGYDYNPETGLYKIIIQFPIHSTEGQGGASYWTVSAWGHTIRDALTNIQKKISHKLNYSHIQLTVVSERLAKSKGILPVINEIERTRDIPIFVLIAVAKDNLEKILVQKNPIQPTNALTLAMKINLNYFEPSTDERVRNFLNKLSQPGIEPIATAIELINSKKSANKHKPDEKPFSKIATIAIFKQDKVVGYFSDRELFGYNLVTNQMNLANRVITAPKDKENLITVQTTLVNSHFKPVIIDNQPRIKLKVQVRGEIINSTEILKITEKSLLTVKLQERLAEVISNDIKAAITKAQELKADIFGFGNSFYRLKYKKWQEIEDNWSTIFANLPVDIEVKATIRRTGMIIESIKPR